MWEARRKEKKKKEQEIYDKLLIDWVGELDQKMFWTSLIIMRGHHCAQFILYDLKLKFPVQPSHSVNKWILLFVKNWRCWLSDCKRIKKNSELSYVNPTLAPQIWASWIAITPWAWNKEIHIMTIILWAW